MTDISVLSSREAELRNLISSRLSYARAFWRPLNQRQDYWMSMYLLLDTIQQSKPLGRRRFISNEPRTSVDAAKAILTRNEMRWRIDLTRAAEENEEARRTIGKIERTLAGIIYDFDDIFAARGEPPFWHQVVDQALLRGWIWAKAHVTLDALKYSESPFVVEVYDARTVYPLFDQFGLNCVIIEKLCHLGELVMLYPEIFSDYERAADYNPWTPAVKIEYWSNTRGSSPGIMCALASVGDPSASTGGQANLLDAPIGPASRFIIPPIIHEYPANALPVVGVPVNGMTIKMKPQLMGILESRLAEKADLMALQLLSWHGPGTWVAESGRSILSAVEDQMPQYNELIATIFQHFTIGTYGTWVFTTQRGQLPEWEPGIESHIALRIGETAQRVEPAPISPDAFRLIEILTNERQKGVLSNILQAVVPFTGTGILFQQITNAALNALEPYMSGIRQFGTRLGTSLLQQLQLAADDLEPFEVAAPTPKRTYFRIEFDPKVDLDKTRRYRPVPILKPALPDDLTIRMTAARQALDPRRPLLSLITVLETILQVEDPAGELDRIWEDIAQMDPVLVTDQIADALERLGEPEMAARMRETEFRQKMIEDLRFRQLTGGIPQLPGREPGPGPETGAPVATQRTGETERELGGLEREGAAVLGELGETLMP